MAVVQISRIQIRRGLENQGGGLPQLSSGELAWAVDTQSLYIGNGSVAEGAPQVGNTRILTTGDDIFALADQYTYKSDDASMQTGTSASAPVLRTLQERLDDFVTLKSFGCEGDNTDCTAAFQRAIDQLYINNATKTNPNSRIVLKVPAGRYTFSDTVYLPPYATIVGEGIDKTIITRTGTGPVFRTVNGTSTPGNPANDATTANENQARHIYVSGITVNTGTDYRAFQLENCRNSIFENIKINGGWVFTSGLVSTEVGIELNSLSTAVTCKENIFRNIEFNELSYAVSSDYDVVDNKFENCLFRDCGYGVTLGRTTNLGVNGELTGPLNTVIKNSVFERIAYNGIWVKEGKYTLSHGNRFEHVGTTTGGEGNAEYPVIKFETDTNLSTEDQFDRSYKLSSDQNYITGFSYVPEVEGSQITELNYPLTVDVTQQFTFTRLARLPASTDVTYRVDYMYRSTQVNAMRRGSLEIAVDVATEGVQIADEYIYEGDSSFTEGLLFEAVLSDEDADATKETLLLNYKNSTASDTGTFRYKVTAIA